MKRKNYRKETRYVKNVKPLNNKQEDYMNSIRKYPITFGVGSAGSGKTFVAVAEAVRAYENSIIDRIILVRPAVTTENFGFLPGTIEEKLDPYLRPIFDALYDRWDPKEVTRLRNIDTIELAPIAYLRGRNFHNSFIILDEAQNTTIKQMKMFLTRLGQNVTCVVTGDPSQSDLTESNGLEWACDKLKESEMVNIVEFNDKHTVRSEIVQDILKYI